MTTTFSPVPLTILHHDDTLLIAQTQAGIFDKFGNSDDKSVLYGEFNFGLHVGDDSARVLANRAALLNTLSSITNQSISLHWLNQVHGDAIFVADHTPKLLPAAADALISHRVNQGLVIMTADCVPVVLYDKNSAAVACIHAGWQGLVNGIISKTAQKLHTPTSCIAAHIGACISQAAYQIDKTLADRIIDEVVQAGLVRQNQQDLAEQILAPSDAGKVLIDINKLTKLQLDKLGISYQAADTCSYQTPNLYSYRAQTHAKRAATGRMATIVVRLQDCQA